MENASKALIIAGAILLSILIIAIGMYIYTSSQATIQNSMTDMNTQEIQAFNSNFTAYEGKQTGSQVKALIQKLVANARTYSEEPAKIPTVLYFKSPNDKTKANTWATNAKGGQMTNKEVNSNAGGQGGYTKALSDLSNGISAKHTYWVQLDTGSSSLIENVSIYYEEDQQTDQTGYTSSRLN